MAEQRHFQTRFVAGRLQGADAFLDFRFLDGVADASALIERLAQVDGIVLRPVGGIGARGLGESLAENDGLADDSGIQPDAEFRQTLALCRFASCGGHLLADAVGFEEKAVADARVEKRIERNEARLSGC